jgi:hypothetical protein
MNEPDDEEPRFYLEDFRQISGKPKWRRSQYWYPTIKEARQALESGEVSWGPWTNQAYRRKTPEVPGGERVKRTKNWEWKTIIQSSHRPVGQPKKRRQTVNRRFPTPFHPHFGA